MLKTTSTNSLRGWIVLGLSMVMWIGPSIVCIANIIAFHWVVPQILVLSIAFLPFTLRIARDYRRAILDDQVRTYIFERQSQQLKVICQSLRNIQTFQFCLKDCRGAFIEERPIDKFWNQYQLVLCLNSQDVFRLSGTRTTKKPPQNQIAEAINQFLGVSQK